MNLPKVSVLLPVFNGEQFLVAAIESVLEQSYSDFELLIADDASSDGSPGIIEDFAKRDRRIVYWRNSRNLGLFKNYNECLARSQGEFVKPFAQDDLLNQEALAKLLALLENDPTAALVSCARRYIDLDGRPVKIVRDYSASKSFTFTEVLEDNLLTLRNQVGEPSAVMFPKRYSGSGFDSSYYHLGDIEYWFRIIEHGKYLYLDEPLCSFRQHRQSTTNKNAKGLRFALDMVHMGKAYQSHLEGFGITQDTYLRMIAEASATHLKHLTRRQGVTLADFLAVEHDNIETRDKDIERFKELLFYTLLLASDTLEENYSLKQEWEAERISLEDKIAKFMGSRSWQVTVPLRGVIKTLRFLSSGRQS